MTNATNVGRLTAVHIFCFQVGDLMAQLLLPEAVRPEEVEAVTAELVKARLVLNGAWVKSCLVGVTESSTVRTEAFMK